MQIGAINLNKPQNFKGYDEPKKVFEDCEYKDITDEPKADTFESSFDEEDEASLAGFIDDVTKARNNVNPLTCLVGILAGYATLRSASKMVGYMRGFAATGAQEATKGIVKLTSKAFKSIDTTKADGKIDKFFSKFNNSAQNPIDINNEKATQKAKTIITSIFGEQSKKDKLNNIARTKGDKFVDALNGQGIYLNGRSLFDNAVALGAAYYIADSASDVTEGALDGRKIEKSAIKNLGNLKTFNKIFTEVLEAVD